MVTYKVTIKIIHEMNYSVCVLIPSHYSDSYCYFVSSEAAKIFQATC